MAQTAANKKRKLGSWFPSASLIKVNTLDADVPVTICLFYQYVQPLWSDNRKNEAVKFVETLAIRLNIGGRVRVASEGFNATISGTSENVRSFTSSLASFDDHFKTTDFKYLDNLKIDRAFKDLKVLPVKELVFYGIDAEAKLGDGGIHLEPEEYHKMLGGDNTVVIDVRNKYEADIGRFGKQEINGGAQLIIPEIRKSTDFPEWFKSDETKSLIQGKNVLMYCTGGVRCERASSYLKQNYGNTVKGVYQLQGGIEKYLKTFPDGGYWQGKNFVFDKREAISAANPDGVGGVLKNKKKKNKNENEKDEEIFGQCCACNIPWDRYIGKKKCSMCGVPVLLCEKCCTLKIDKQIKNVLKMRCPICVKENCTIPVEDLELTSNGTKVKLSENSSSSSSSSSSSFSPSLSSNVKNRIQDDDDDGSFKIHKKNHEKMIEEGGGGKAAPSVCKWGGGHANKASKLKKSMKLSSKPKDLKSVPCRFGKSCSRSDCWFSHE